MNQGTYQPVGTEIGLGVKTAATTRVFTQGIAISTGRQLDIEIEGEGFFASYERRWFSLLIHVMAVCKLTLLVNYVLMTVF